MTENVCNRCGKPKCSGELTLYYDGGFFSCSVCDSVFVAKLPNQAIYRCHGHAPQPVAEPTMPLRPNTFVVVNGRYECGHGRLPAERCVDCESEATPPAPPPACEAGDPTKMQARIEELESAFRHVHRARYEGTQLLDSCFTCGLDLRDPIHERIPR